MSNPVGLISYHSFGQYLLYPIGGEYQEATNEAFMKGVSQKMEKLIGDVNGRTYRAWSASEFYVAAGDAVDWFWRQWDGRMALTVELRPEEGNYVGFMITADQVPRRPCGGCACRCAWGQPGNVK